MLRSPQEKRLTDSEIQITAKALNQLISLPKSGFVTYSLPKVPFSPHPTKIADYGNHNFFAFEIHANYNNKQNAMFK